MLLNRHSTIWATTTFRISPTIVHRIYALWNTTIPALCQTYAYAELSSELTFQALPSAPPSDNPNTMGFAPGSAPEKDLLFLQIIFFFQDASATDGLYNELKNFIRLFEKEAEKEGVKHDYLYLNFAAWFQDPLAAYGKEQLKQLKHVAKKYDPEGFYQKQLDKGFKLF